MKHGWHVLRVKAPESHPAGVRGLKHVSTARGFTPSGVAPRRGAWIET